MHPVSIGEIPYFSVASRSPVDLQKGSTNEVTDRDDDGDGYDRLDR